IDDPAAEDHLALGVREANLPILVELNAGRAPVLERDARRLRVHLHVEIAPAEHGPQIGVGRAAAPAVADRDLHAREPVLLFAVVVLRYRVAGGEAGLEPGIEERIRLARFSRDERPAAAAIRAAAAFPRFLALEVGQRSPIGPAAQPVDAGPALVVGAVAAR